MTNTTQTETTATETRSPRRIAADAAYAAQVAELTARHRAYIDSLTEAQGGEQGR